VQLGYCGFVVSVHCLISPSVDYRVLDSASVLPRRRY
jgi:hypothetical protein